MSESREATDQDLGPVVFPFNEEEQKTIRQAAESVNVWLRDGGEVPSVSIRLLRAVAIFAVDESRDILAQSAEAKSVQVPKGWRMVPEEPTPEMRNAFHAVTEDEAEMQGASASRWAAMLASSPMPPAQPQDAKRIERLKFDLRQVMIDYGAAVRANDPERIRSTTSAGVALIDSLAPVAKVEEKPAAQASLTTDQVAEAMRKRFVKLPRFSFLLGDPTSVRRVPDRYGNWLDFQQVHELFDPVQVDAALRDAGLIGEGSKA